MLPWDIEIDMDVRALDTKGGAEGRGLRRYLFRENTKNWMGG